MKIVKYMFIFTVCLYLGGCASGAKMENMVFKGDQKTYPAALKNNLEVTKVAGGEETNPLWTSEISNEAFSGAVKESLIAQGLYSDGGKYQLEVRMTQVDQPLFGLSLTVVTHVRYVLINKEDRSIVINEMVVAPYTATVGDAFAAIKRLRLANEGSAKKNIEGLLNELSRLRINPKEISLAE